MREGQNRKRKNDRVKVGQKQLVGVQPHGKKLHLRRIQRRAQRNPPQLQDPVPHIAILSQMSRSRGPAAGCHHLVKRPPLNKLRIKFPAELARPAGARIKAFHHRCINVFHEGFSWEARTGGSCGKMILTAKSSSDGNGYPQIGKRSFTTAKHSRQALINATFYEAKTNNASARGNHSAQWRTPAGNRQIYSALIAITLKFVVN
jgi:hypothetical protein